MRVKAKETTIFEGQKFDAGKVYDVDETTFKTLGSSVEKIEEKKEKVIEKAKNTMMSGKKIRKK